MANEIQAGDSVVLKCGGPVMLVLEVASARSGKKAHVRWIDGNTRDQEAEFPFSILELVTEKTLSRSGLLPAFFRGRSLNRLKDRDVA